MTLLTGVKLAETSLDSDRDSISDASVGVRKLPDLATGVEFGVSPTKTNRVFQCIVVLLQTKLFNLLLSLLQNFHDTFYT